MSRLIALGDIVAALGYTPYDANNPAGYVNPAWFNAHLPTPAAPKDAPQFTGTVVVLGLLDAQGGLLQLSSTGAALTLGKAGQVSTPVIKLLSSGYAGRAFDAQFAVTGGSSTIDGQGAVNLQCASFSINGQPVAAGVATPATTLPLPNAAAALTGSATTFARGDHVHPTDSSAWTLINPTATTGTGTASMSVNLRHKKIGRTVHINLLVAIASAGTGNGAVSVPLPFPAAFMTVLTGREIQVTGKAITGAIATNGSTMTLLLYDGNSPIGSSYWLSVSGTYEATT